MIKEIVLAIIVGIFTQFLLTPIMYALHPAYYSILVNAPFGLIVIFLLDNFGFFIFAALVLYIWKGLQAQQQQNTPIYGAG